MNRIKSQFLTLTVLIFTASSVPLQAAIAQQQKGKQLDPFRQLEGCRWDRGRRKCPGGGSFIWERLRRRRIPGGSRGTGSESRTCAITPGALFDLDNQETTTIQVWSDRPFFLWQGSWSRIEVRSVRGDQLMWSQPLDPNQRHIVYGEDGKSLQPGRAYYWRLFPAESSQNFLPRITFRILEPKEREAIEAEFAQVEGETAEEIALSRANYFAQGELWSDALGELYGVENPSEEVLETIEQIQEIDFCNLADMP